MCKDATATAASLMLAVKPTLTSFLTLAGVSTAEQTTVLNAYDSAETAVQNWVPGTLATNVINLLTDFNTVFDALPVPVADQELASLILGGITAVVAVLTANEPKEPTVTVAAQTAREATVKIKTLVPEVKKIDLHHPEKAVEQYNELWAAKVARIHPTPPSQEPIDAAQQAHEEAIG